MGAKPVNNTQGGTKQDTDILCWYTATTTQKLVKKSKLLYAWLVIEEMWVDHERSMDIKMPRSLCW